MNCNSLTVDYIGQGRLHLQQLRWHSQVPILDFPVTDKYQVHGAIMQPSHRQLPVDSCQLGLMDAHVLASMTQVMQDTLSSAIYDPSFGALENINVSASAPVSIPKTATCSPDDLNDFVGDTLGLDLMAATSDLEFDETLSSSFGAVGEYSGELESPLSPSLWSPTEETNLKSDDFLAVDKADPTLAELNLKRDQSLLDSFVDDFDLPLLSPEEASTNILTGGDSLEIPKSQWVGDKINTTNCSRSSAQEVLSSSFPGTGLKETAVSMPVPCNFSTMWNAQLKEKEIQPPTIKCEKQPPLLSAIKQEKDPLMLPATQQESKHNSTLHELLTQRKSDTKFKPQPLTAESSPNVCSRLSSSAPTQPFMEQTWRVSSQALQQSPENQDGDTDPKSETSVTTNEVFHRNDDLDSHHNDDLDSHDEGFDSEPEDTDHYDELTSDAESTVSEDFDAKRTKSSSSPPTKHIKKEKFFWQYNVQAKGPKISRLCLSPHKSDPHRLNKITDPVFSPGCYIQGIKHSGKARRGDGNDLNPNARKLFQIGQELRKLNRVINDLTPVSELPFTSRPKSRKEKNKLASRACRLKKKAQHEANKLKLYGLEDEHCKLTTALDETRKLIVQRVKDPNSDTIYDKIDNLMNENNKTKVAGCTSEYVNRILGSITEGKPMDELEDDD